MNKAHSGCCGCASHADGMDRRAFFASIGGSALGASVLAGCATTGAGKGTVAAAPRMAPVRKTKTLTVQPVLTWRPHERHEQTSWRPWGGLHTEADVAEELKRIQTELDTLRAKAEFPLEIRPLARVAEEEEAGPLVNGDADVMLIYGAGAELEPLISEKRHNLVFVRHKSGPVYLWYEIVSPLTLRKAVDELGQPGLQPEDVIVDDYKVVGKEGRGEWLPRKTAGLAT